MPRYFISTFDGGSFPDNEGMELADDEAARAEALRALPDIGKELIRPEGGDDHALTIVVYDALRSPIYTAILSFAGTWIRG